MTLMNAVLVRRYGGPEVLEVAQVVRPKPAAHQVLVKVHACGLNPVDYKLREGALRALFELKFPRILGGDISGVVVERGENAHDFEVGDEVYFSNPLDEDGGNAEFVAVHQTFVARKPASLSHVEAASLPVVGLTAIQALRDFSKVKAKDKVLIHAGAGGVGSFAIPYAKHLGALVFTTAGADRVDYVKSLGADRIIDYQKEDFVSLCKKEGGMDVVFETVGGTNYPRSLEAAREGASVPCIVNPPDSDTLALSEKKRIKTDFMLLNGNRNDLDEISRLVEAGIVKTNVYKTFPLQEARAAHELVQSGKALGKVVLKIV